MGDPSTEWLMRPEHVSVPRRRTKAKWPISTKPPRCKGCGNQPPACECREEES